MSRRCKASSLSLALLLAACPGDDGGATTTEAADSTTAAATTSGDPPATTGTDDPTTTTTAAGPSTGAVDDSSTGEAGSTGPSGSTGPDPCESSVLTWENFGEPFMLTWCTGCHHSALPTAQRAGAPCSANFDTHAGASERAAVIQLRALDWMTVQGIGPMPPAAIVPDDDLALLREWLECGAPGPETGQSGPACPDP